MQLKGSGEVTLEKLLGGIGYADRHHIGRRRGPEFLDAQAAGQALPADRRLLTLRQSARTGRLRPDEARHIRAGPGGGAMPPAGRRCWAPDLLATCGASAAATTALDTQVAALVAKLTQKKLLDATLMVLTSPCGSLLGRQGLWGAGDASDPVNMYEESSQRR